MTRATPPPEGARSGWEFLNETSWTLGVDETSRVGWLGPVGDRPRLGSSEIRDACAVLDLRFRLEFLIPEAPTLGVDLVVSDGSLGVRVNDSSDLERVDGSIATDRFDLFYRWLNAYDVCLRDILCLPVTFGGSLEAFSSLEGFVYSLERSAQDRQLGNDLPRVAAADHREEISRLYRRLIRDERGTV